MQYKLRPTDFSENSPLFKDSKDAMFIIMFDQFCPNKMLLENDFIKIPGFNLKVPLLVIRLRSCASEDLAIWSKTVCFMDLVSVSFFKQAEHNNVSQLEVNQKCCFPPKCIFSSSKRPQSHGNRINRRWQWWENQQSAGIHCGRLQLSR